jgi:hypothetical protein
MGEEGNGRRGEWEKRKIRTEDFLNYNYKAE